LPFTIDYLALGILTLICLIGYWLHQKWHPSPDPSLAFSNLQAFPLSTKYLQRARLPQKLYQWAFLAWCVAFIDPHILLPKDTSLVNPQAQIPNEGVAIYLIVDQSSSMNEKISTNGFFKRGKTLTKIDLLKEVAAQFISHRPSDLIGFVSFARVPKILSPLTLDHETLLIQLKDLKAVSSIEEDGTAMGYAIYKTAHLIVATKHFGEELQHKGKPAYEIKNSIMVVLTDGFQDPNRLDYGNRLRMIELDEATAYAKSQGIHLYVINVDPKFSSSQFAPHRRQLESLLQTTGGQLYLANREEDLKHVFDTIDRLEKSPLPPDSDSQPPLIMKRRFSFYPYLIALGLIFLLAGAVLETTWLKKFP
jgi:Ca-activated chloride channel family protein